MCLWSTASFLQVWWYDFGVLQKQSLQQDFGFNEFVVETILREKKRVVEGGNTNAERHGWAGHHHGSLWFSPTGGCLRSHIECISELSLWQFWNIHTDPHIPLAVGCFHRYLPSNICGPSFLCWIAFLGIKEGKKNAERPPSRHLRWGLVTMWNCPAHLTLHQAGRWWHVGHHKRLKH